MFVLLSFFIWSLCYSSGASEFSSAFLWGSSYSICSFMCMSCRSLSVILSFFFWPLCCLSFLELHHLITPLVSSNSSFGHCVSCPSIYRFWLPLWYLQTLLLAIVLSVLLWFTDSDYPFGIFKFFFWPLCCLFFFDLRILITPLVSSNCSWYMSTTHSVPITATVSNSNPFEDTKGIVWSRES